MTETINSLKDSLQRLLDMAESGPGEAYRARLRKAANVVVENEGKIWMRTRVGKPLLERLMEASERAARALRGSDQGGLADALKDLEDAAEAIVDESRRRSMVVT